MNQECNTTTTTDAQRRIIADERMPTEVVQDMIRELKTAHIDCEGVDADVLAFCSKLVSPLEELLILRRERDELLNSAEWKAVYGGEE